MRAVMVRKFGQPLVEEVASPTASADEVVVAVRAAGINPSDVKNIEGKMHGTTLPRIPGRDFAGVVVEGPAELKGQEVFGTGGDLGFTRDGSHAELIRVPQAALVNKPPALAMDAAGAAGVTFVTAWSALVTAAEVAAEETVVVIGATGGVGSAAVQIARSRGARVIAVVRSESDMATARRHGADDAINSKSAAVGDAVRSLTQGRGANVVFDTSGMTFADAVDAAAVDARVPVISAPPDGHSTFNLRDLYRKTLRVLGVDTRQLDSIACAKLLREMLPGFSSGAFRPAQAEPCPLESALKAYRDASEKRIVLKP